MPPVQPLRIRRLLAGVTALSMAAVTTAGIVPAVSAAATCRVRNLDTGVTQPSLSRAVDDASAGARLQVKGHCVGSTIIDKHLTIVGKRTAATGKPILDGDHAERVLWVLSGSRVTVKNLTIRNGTSNGLEGSIGGGIYNNGRLTLTNVVVRDNQATDGGGIASTGRLILSGNTQVAFNNATRYGGGVFVSGALGQSSMIMNHASAVHHNSAAFGAGVADEGSVTLNDVSSIYDNYAGLNAHGGGIEIWWTAGTVAPSLTLTDQSRVKNNTAGPEGGGVVTWPDCGLIPVLSGAGATRVTDNTPANKITETGC